MSYIGVAEAIYAKLGRKLDENAITSDLGANIHMSLYVHTNTGWVDDVYYHSEIAQSGKTTIKGWTMGLLFDE